MQRARIQRQHAEAVAAEEMQGQGWTQDEDIRRAADERSVGLSVHSHEGDSQSQPTIGRYGLTPSVLLGIH